MDGFMVAYLCMLAAAAGVVAGRIWADAERQRMHQGSELSQLRFRVGALERVVPEPAEASRG